MKKTTVFLLVLFGLFLVLHGTALASEDASVSTDTYRQAAEQGDAEAQYQLGLMYEIGDWCGARL